MRGISIKQLYDDTKDDFQLEILNSVEESPIPISVSDIHRPAFALTGFLRNFLSERIQILGETELLYLDTLSGKEKNAAIGRLFRQPIPCVIISKGLDYPEQLLKSAGEKGVPVIRTPLSTTPFIHLLTQYLEEAFAPCTHIHGSLVDVYGVGLLITGPSGIGKSECALDLVERGHRLVADDLVITVRKQKDLRGTASESLRNHMEIRGIGIVDVRRMFGVRSVCREKKISVEVRLRKWGADVQYDRLGLDERMTTILGLKVPVVTIPIIPGKNITVIVELVAMNHLLRIQGLRPAEKLNEKIIGLMKPESSEWEPQETDN